MSFGNGRVPISALGHTNEPLLGLFLSGFTEATPGPNGFEDQNNGIDGIQGSTDDQRGDDINVVWYRREDNNPFMMGAVVDSTTYSRDLDDLPNTGGHDKFVQNANNSVGSNIFSLPNARAVMFTSRRQGEETRTLGFDDVATVRLGQSGVDETQGTGDDYTIQLELIGKVPDCQVIVRFETPQGGVLGRCEVTLNQISGNHYRIGPQALVRINPDPSLNWHFGDSPDLSIDVSDGDVSVSAGDLITYTIEVVNLGVLAPTGLAEIATSVPDNTMFDAGASAPEWSCASAAPGSPCTLSVDLQPGAPAQQFLFVVAVDEPLPDTVAEIVLSAQVTGAGGEANPMDNFAMETTPIVVPPEVFADGFESGDTSAWDQTIP